MIQIIVEKYPETKAKWRKIIILFSLAVILFIPYLISPEALPLPECAFRSLIGFDCPTCGITRSMFAISHGMIIDALRYHFAGIILYIVLLILAFKLVLEVIAGWIIHIKLHKKVIKATIILIGGVWFLLWMADLFITI